MQHDHPILVRMRKSMDDGLVTVELAGLLITGIATTVAIAQEVMVMVNAGRVELADLLLMFLYLEVLAMIGQYLRTGQIQVRFPIYIAIVALARYLIIETKDIETMRILSVAGAILFLTLAVLVVRYGHRRFPYDDNAPDRDEEVTDTAGGKSSPIPVDVEDSKASTFEGIEDGSSRDR